MKRPIKADYIKKYGFSGIFVWRIDLIKYEEAQNALKRAKENQKIYLKNNQI